MWIKIDLFVDDVEKHVESLYISNPIVNNFVDKKNRDRNIYPVLLSYSDNSVHSSIRFSTSDLYLAISVLMTRTFSWSK